MSMRPHRAPTIPVHAMLILALAAGGLGACKSSGAPARDGRVASDGIDGSAIAGDSATPVRDSSTPASDAPYLGDGPPTQSACTGHEGQAIAGAMMPTGYCSWIWATGLSSPRGIAVAANGDVLVIERGHGSVTLLYDADGDGASGATERAVLATAPGLNHGIALHDGFLYASSASTVYRWPYSAGMRTALGDPTVVVRDLPTGGHSTRTLAIDAEGRLYVSVGSGSNVDSDSSRARIVRYALGMLPAGGATFAQGELFADGLRNEVGLDFDAGGRLWGVENGVDNLSRTQGGFPGDIHQDNPGEELNLFATAGRFYGYPYCWSEGSLPQGVGRGATTQWADPTFIGGPLGIDDAWCQDPSHVVAPVLVLQAHSAPLGLLFYRANPSASPVVGDAFVTLHGSWNRSPPTGYKVVRIAFGAKDMPIAAATPQPVLEYAGGGDIDSAWPHRPVGLAATPDGVLLVTSDSSGVLIAIGVP